MSLKNILLSSCILAVLSCSKSDVPTPEPIVADPSAATLVFPENNKECNEGTIINDTQSKVSFRWNDSEDTETYEVNIENLENRINSKIEVTINEIEIIIERGAAYQWYVISKSNGSDQIATSETWKFYNASPGIVNYAPFPADVAFPMVGSQVAANSGKITLEWSTSDIDNDIKNYEVFFGSENPPINNAGVTVQTSMEINVSSGNKYYWSIITLDEANNTSNSEVFWFDVE